VNPGPFGDRYTLTATAVDDTGDPILYTFTADDGVTQHTLGPQPENVGSFVLRGEGWEFSVTVDDDPRCDDAANDATFPPPEGEGLGFLRGDCNGDGNVVGQVGDAVFVLNFNFTGGPTPSCMAACDSNADGNVVGQVGDAIYTLNFNFLGGPAIPAPFPECGRSTDPADLALGCEVETCP